MRVTIVAALLSVGIWTDAPAQIFYSLQRNDTLTYLASAQIAVSMRSSSPMGPQEMRSGTTSRQSVVRFADDSVLIWFDSVAVDRSSTLPGVTVSKMIQGQILKLHWDRRGGVTASQNVPRMDDLRSMLLGNRFFPRLPENGVSLGSMWADTLKPDASGPAGTRISGVYITRYHATRDTMVGGQAGLVIESTGTVDTKTEPAPGSSMQMSGTQKGEVTGLIVLLRNGTIAYNSAKMTIDGSTSVTGAVNMTAEMKGNIEQTTQLIRRR